MRLRHRALAVTASVVLASVGAPAATGGAVACAGEGPSAGLVVDTGEGMIALCVALDAAEVSGLRLIELAGAQHGLSFGFGLGGAAVCRLDGVGPAGDDCFASYPEYWGYWHGDGPGGWTWASSGAASYRVSDGDVEGWVWGTGDTGASHRRPPAVGIDDLCGHAEPPPSSPDSRTDVPSPTTAPTAETSASDRGSAGAQDPAGDEDPEGTQGLEGQGAASEPPHGEGPGEERPREPSPGEPSPSAPSTTSDDGEVLSVGVPPADGGGPPTALFVAGSMAALLAAGGWLRLRARARGTS